MAFAASGLKLLMNCVGFNFYLYDTADAAADVDTADYFLKAINQLNIGDVILRRTGTLSEGGLSAITTAGFHVVKDKSATSIDVTDALALTMTDTD